MCQGWCCLYQWQIVKSLDLTESQGWKCQGNYGVPSFSYLCGVSWGRKFFMRVQWFVMNNENETCLVELKRKIGKILP